MCVCVSCSVVSDSVTLWTITQQALLSMGFSRQENWSGLPFPSPILSVFICKHSSDFEFIKDQHRVILVCVARQKTENYVDST